MDQSPASSPPAAQTCPACGAEASGRFCSACGATLVGATCAACGGTLSPGAKFCHRCGTPAGQTGSAAAARSFSSALPWGVAAIALVALVALVAGQRFARTPGGDAGAFQGAAAIDAASGRPPDLSTMTPSDAAVRLYNRVMRLHESGQADSVQLFAPMAMQAYRMLGALDLDQRYDLGRIAAIAGDEATARAEADTILVRSPTHLLGLILAGNAARMRKDPASERKYHDQFIAAVPAERAKQLPEYTAHENDIAIELDAKRP